MLASCSE